MQTQLRFYALEVKHRKTSNKNQTLVCHEKSYFI